MSFEVNPALPRFFFATQKRKDGKHFLVDAFCTDGGGIPRNVIISSGFSLVKLGALSLQEFVFKSSYSATRLYGLKNKGHFSPGADADITIIDFERQKPIHSFVEGKEVLVDGALKGKEANSSQRRKDYRLAKNTKSNHTSLISKIFFLIALKDLQKINKNPITQGVNYVVDRHRYRYRNFLAHL